MDLNPLDGPAEELSEAVQKACAALEQRVADLLQNTRIKGTITINVDLALMPAGANKP
jgi:hypothetical protein